jgi:hypothetical protein
MSDKSNTVTDYSKHVILKPCVEEQASPGYSELPVSPAGFVVVVINGKRYKMPIYND